MTRNGFFTGLDIGTSSIKVLVAELVDGEVNVIGVSNAKSKGVKDGIIVDIEAAATAIKSAISQAEEKAGSVEQKLSDFYKLAMDSVRRNKEGVAPVMPLLREMEAAKTLNALHAIQLKYASQSYGMPIRYGFVSSLIQLWSLIR